MSRPLVVIPTFNEAHTIAALVASIHDALPLAHVLVVDDASADGTGQLVDRLAASSSELHALHRPKKLGLGSAYVEGFRWGLARGFDRFIEMDADFSHDPAYLPRFMSELDAGADLVVGSRNVPGGAVEGWGALRHAISKGGSLYARLILRANVRDLTTGYKAYSRRAVERLLSGELRSNGYAFQIETTYRLLQAGLRVVELPIVFVDRRAGQSKMTRHEIVEAVIAVWTLRAPGRLKP